MSLALDWQPNCHSALWPWYLPFMDNFYAYPPDSFLSAITILFNTLALIALVSIFLPLTGQWRQNTLLGRIFTIKVAIAALWNISGLTGKFLVLSATTAFTIAPPSSTRSVMAVILTTSSIFLFSSISSAHFAFVWTGKHHTVFHQIYIFFGYLWAVFVSVILLFWNKLVMQQIIVSRTLDITAEMTPLGSVLLGLTMICWVYGLGLLLFAWKSKMTFYWLSDVLILAALVAQFLHPPLLGTLMVSATFLVSSISLFYFYSNSDELNVTRIAMQEREHSLVQAQQELKRTQVFNKISQALAHEAHTDAGMMTILDLLNEIVPSRDQTMILLTEDLNQIDRVVQTERSVDKGLATLKDMQWLREGLTGWVLENRLTAISSGVVPDLRESAEVQERRKEVGVGAVLVLPLLYRNTLIGTLTCSRALGEADFTNAEVGIAESAAIQIASTLLNDRKTQKIETALQTSETLRTVGNIINQELEIENLIDALLDNINGAIGFQGLLMIVIDQISEATVSKYRGSGNAQNITAQITWDYIQDHLYGQVLRTHKPVVVSKATLPNTLKEQDQSGIARLDSEIGCFAIVPIMHQKELLGMLAATRHVDAQDFSKTDIEFFEAIANQAGIALKNGRLLHQQVAALARTQRSLLRERTLQNVSKAVNSNLNETELLNALFTEISQAVVSQATVLMTLDIENKKILQKLHRNTRSGDYIDWNWIEGSVTGRAIRQKVTILSPKADEDKQQSERVKQYRTASGLGSILSVPIISDDVVVGAFGLGRHIDQPDFSEAEVSLMESIAELASIALKNSRLLLHEERQRLRAEIMFDIAHAASEQDTLDGLLKTIVDTYYLRTRHRWVACHLLDEATESIQQTYMKGIEGVGENISYAELKHTLVGYTFLNKQPILSPRHLATTHEAAHFTAARDALGVSGAMAAPILDRGVVLGVISVYADTKSPEFTQDDLDLLSAVTKQLANSILTFSAAVRLRQSENQFRTLIQFAPDAILLLDLEEDKFIDANPLACALFKRSKADILSMDPMNLYPDDDRETQRQSRHEIFDTLSEEGQFIGERTFVTANGREFPAEVRVVALPGQKQLARTSIIDITNRKQREASMLQSQKLESLGVMAGGIAHDFNNLLLAMLGQSQIAQRKLGPDNSATKNIVKIEKAAQRASELTRQMMAYAGRGQTAERSAININALIAENTDLLRATIPNTITIHTDLKRGLPIVFGERGQIQQVIMNMMINGSEAIGTGNGDLWVSTSVYTLDDAELQAWQGITTDIKPGQYVRLAFRDNGSGMTPETKMRIFDPFFTTKNTGHGLGLAAVLGIIRSHGGSIRLDSELGIGTMFQILFPIDLRKQNRGSAETPTADLDALAGKTILVIDDDESVLETISETLRSYEMNVHQALSGTDGIALFRDNQNAIDLTLVDVSMPGISGVETMRQLHKIQAQAKVILSSGYNQLDADKVAELEDNVTFLQKPYRTEQLLDLIGVTLIEN